MKAITTTVLLAICFWNTTFSQVKIGNNPSAIGAGSLLELESTSKAFLPPRMTTAQRNAIPSPVDGMIIYNNTTGCINTFQNGVWFDQCAFNKALFGGQKINRLLGGSDLEQPAQIQQTTDGGYIIAGYSFSSTSGDVSSANHGTYDYWVVKLDALGNIAWNKLLGGTGDDTPFGIQQTSDGGYIVAGRSSSSASGNVTGTSHGSYDCWVVKLDASGNIIWDKLFGGTSYDAAVDILQTPDGGYVFLGYSLSSASGDVTGVNHGMQDYWIVKLDATGNITWNKLIGGSSDEWPANIRKTSDGGYIVSGYSFSSFTGNVISNNHGGSDEWIVKLDASGNISWSKLLGGTGNDESSWIEQTADDGYIIAGSSTSSVSGNVSGTNHGGYDQWIVKLDVYGNTDWNKLLGGNLDERARSVAQCADGGYILAGYSQSSLSGDVSGTSHGGLDYWIVKLDAAGSTTWNRLLGGSGTDAATCILQTGDGGYIVAGDSNSSSSGNITAFSHGLWDWWIVKLNRIGMINE